MNLKATRSAIFRFSKNMLRRFEICLKPIVGRKGQNRGRDPENNSISSRQHTQMMSGVEAEKWANYYRKHKIIAWLKCGEFMRLWQHIFTSPSCLLLSVRDL